MTEKTFNRFKKVLSKFINKINIDGITFSMTEHTSRKKIFGYTFEVPVIKIHNVKNVPFSYNSLHDLFTQELEVINDYASTDIHPGELELSFDFDDFDTGEFYIPTSIEKKLRRCLNTDFIEIKYRNNNNIVYTLRVEYQVDNVFDLYWEDTESFKITISLLCNSVFKDDLITGKFGTITDKEEIARLIYDIRYDDPSIFEDSVWDCINETLLEYRCFLNRDWQYVDVNVIPI
jgi:hypothetical protein